MGTGMALLAGLGSAASEGLKSGMGSGLNSTISGLISDAGSGIFGGRKRHNQRKMMRYAMELQDQYEKERMKQQYEYAKEAAAQNQEYAKEMWDYTNFENQRKHLEEAGLNPGLLYGMSGGGGSSASGAGRVEAPEMGRSAAVAMGLQASMQQAQIRDLEASARLKEAEAAKTAGVDTEKVKSDIKVNESTTNLNEILKKVREKEGKNIDQQTENLKKEFEKLRKEIGILAVQEDIAANTKEAAIQKAINECWNAMYTGFEIVGKIELNEKQKNFIQEQINWYGYQTLTGRISAKASEKQAEAATKNADTLENRLTEEVKKWTKELSQEQQRIVQAWVGMAAGTLGDIVKQILDNLPTKTIRKIFDRGFDRFEEITTTKGK